MIANSVVIVVQVYIANLVGIVIAMFAGMREHGIMNARGLEGCIG
jgi:hypothetical protein